MNTSLQIWHMLNQSNVSSIYGSDHYIMSPDMGVSKIHTLIGLVPQLVNKAMWVGHVPGGI